MRSRSSTLRFGGERAAELIVVAAIIAAALAWGLTRSSEHVASGLRVVAVDQPVPAGITAPLDDELGLTSKPAAGQLAADQARVVAALHPIGATRPRVVARLGAYNLLIAWHTRADVLCLHVASRFGLSMPFGPCQPAYDRATRQAEVPPCGEICVHWAAGAPASGGTTTYLLGGLVAPEGDALRVWPPHGGPKAYALNGPLYEGRRIVLLPLGQHAFRKLELLRGGRPIAVTALPALVVGLLGG